MPKPALSGIVTALVTPFRDDDERIDFNAWQRIIDYQIASGVDGLLAVGGQGEFYSIDEEERIVALRFCRQAVGGRASLYGNSARSARGKQFVWLRKPKPRVSITRS